MCLTKISEQQVTTENIFCYKPLYKNRRAVIQNFKYTLGKVNKLVKITPMRNYWDPNEIIEEGYHSWINKPRIHAHLSEEVYLCVIPKGTIYYKGLENDTSDGYVSETIVVLGRVNNIWNKFFTNLRKSKYIK